MIRWWALLWWLIDGEVGDAEWVILMVLWVVLFAFQVSDERWRELLWRQIVL